MPDNCTQYMSSAKATCMQIYTQEPTANQLIEARKLAESLRLEQSDSILRFGSSIQAKMPPIADKLIEISRRDDTAETARFIEQITASIDSFCKIAKPGLFGTSSDKACKVFESYRALKINILRSTASLESSRRSLIRTGILLEQIHAQNLELYNELTVAVSAGELRLRDIELQGDAQPFAENIDRFEKKLYDLKLSKSVCVQTAVQIFFLKNSCDSLMDRIQSIITTIVPLWETQVSLALGISNISSQIAGLSSASASLVSVSKKSAREIKDASTKLKSELDNINSSISEDKKWRSSTATN